jgi:hypothetical protein
LSQRYTFKIMPPSQHRDSNAADEEATCTSK